MQTRFGKWISGENFPRVFFILYILFMWITAWMTNRAFRMLFERNHLFGLPYILFAVFAIMVIEQKNSRRRSIPYKKFIGFLTCFLIYDVFTLAIWGIVCFIFQVGGNAEGIGTLTLTAVSFLTVLFGYLYTKVIRTTAYSIKLGTAGNRYRIALISDIHMGAFVDSKHIEKVVNRINDLQPDMVLIAGDIFDVDHALLENTAELEKISKAFRRLRTKGGVYAVAGNHDPKLGDRTFRKFMEDSCIRLLDDEVVSLPTMNLVGRTDAANNRRRPIEEFLPQCDPTKPIIIIDHDPQHIREAAAANADLVLCGHTHRGQFFPVTLFTKWANGKHYFYGHEFFGKTHAVITSGAGFFQLPVRVGTSNEIADIQLQI